LSDTYQDADSVSRLNMSYLSSLLWMIPSLTTLVPAE
jgi:hypothetical protein